MKRMSWPIILLLVFALLIQNTCPKGFAGKTGLAPTCGHCSSKNGTVTLHDGEKILSSHHHKQLHFPMFVFSVPETTPTFHPQRLRTARPITAEGYKDAFPGELLKPPSS